MKIRRWLPNIVTLGLAALLVITQQVWADPIAARLASSNSASSKTTINYQGYLADSAGNPVNDTLDMAFRLYNVESGGDAIWDESHFGVSVDKGLFSVALGEHADIPDSVLVNNDALWLGIAIGGDEEMSPRERLSSVPFARVTSRLQAETYPFSRGGTGETNLISYRDPSGEQTTLDTSTCGGGWCCNGSDTICLYTESGVDSILAFNIQGAPSIACTLLHEEDDRPGRNRGIYFSTDAGNQSPFGTWTGFISREGVEGVPISPTTGYRWICF